MNAWTLLAVLCLAPQPAHYDAPGPDLAFQSAEGIQIQREGQRPLSVRVTFPKTGGPYPVIVWSHGMYGSEAGNDPLVHVWAAAGYVVVQPTHGDSLRLATPEARRGALRGSLDNIDSWNERPGEISLVIDSLEWLERTVPGLAGKVDEKTVGMGGHSFGAWTAQVVAGMTLRGGITMIDPRPKAFVMLSPSGIGGGITEASFRTMRGPTLMVSGDLDRGRFAGDPKVVRRQAHDLSPAGGRILVWIKDAHHNLGGISGRGAELLRSPLMGPNDPQMVRVVQSSTLAFWDLHLKQRPEARAWWSAQALEQNPGVTVSQR